MNGAFKRLNGNRGEEKMKRIFKNGEVVHTQELAKGLTKKENDSLDDFEKELDKLIALYWNSGWNIKDDLHRNAYISSLNYIIQGKLEIAIKLSLNEDLKAIEKCLAQLPDIMMINIKNNLKEKYK